MTEDKVNPEALRDAAVVILANCGGLSEAQYKASPREFVASGGGLLVFPGEKVNPDAYNKQFFPVPGPQKEALTAADAPGRRSRATRRSREGPGAAGLDRLTPHPALLGLRRGPTPTT